MNNELKTTIKNFLVDWDTLRERATSRDTSMDEGFGLSYYDLWMTTAISLLEQTIEEKNNKE